ncbi:MAG: cupin domain-containing protein [Devosia sp.]
MDPGLRPEHRGPPHAGGAGHSRRLRVPWHLHHSEDESFYVLEGQMTMIAGETRQLLGPGDFAFGPRGVAHGFRIEGDAPARILLITSGGDFGAFVAEMSVSPDVAPSPPELALFAAAAQRHNIDILGPLPR